MENNYVKVVQTKSENHLNTQARMHNDQVASDPQVAILNNMSMVTIMFRKTIT